MVIPALIDVKSLHEYTKTPKPEIIPRILKTSKHFVLISNPYIPYEKPTLIILADQVIFQEICEKLKCEFRDLIRGLKIQIGGLR